MSVPLSAIVPPQPTEIDQRVLLHGVSWEDYEAILAIRGEALVPRMTYLEGELELMSPSVDHEGLKKRLARLIEAFAEERGITLEGFGSWTVRSKPKRRGAEADECYILGVPESEPIRPDIAIEVVWTSGGLSKLEVYRGLAVPEVWIWQDSTLSFHILTAGDYASKPHSDLLPNLDPELLTRCMAAPSQTQAVMDLRRALQMS
ncbi:MAG: Uma2 family endonuclease [Chromatiales bacterium]|nr:Uma2 family endonuclease [Chromatiales bacterium]